MLSILLMIIGGLMIIASVVGYLMYVFQPLIEDFQVVIKREDDYAHYTSPTGLAYLQSRKKRYLSGLAIMLAVGCILFFTGLFMMFGSRGRKMLFSLSDDSTLVYDAVDSELAKGFDEKGNFISSDGKKYSNYVIVKGTKVYYRNELVGSADDFASYVSKLDKTTSIFVLDGYASAPVYKEVIRILEENGFEYETE